MTMPAHANAPSNQPAPKELLDGYQTALAARRAGNSAFHHRRQVLRAAVAGSPDVGGTAVAGPAGGESVDPAVPEPPDAVQVPPSRV